MTQRPNYDEVRSGFLGPWVSEKLTAAPARAAGFNRELNHFPLLKPAGSNSSPPLGPFTGGFGGSVVPNPLAG